MQHIRPRIPLLAKPVLAAAWLALAVSSAIAQGEPQVSVRPVSVPMPNLVVLVDGKAIEAQSMQLVRGQQVMVWLRDLETLGWGSIQPGRPGQFVFRGKNVTLTFIKGQSVALVNSLAVELPVDTKITDGRLMVPLSFVAKSLGYKYESAHKLVVSVTTAGRKPSESGENSLRGQVAYNNKPVKGIKVRAADSEYKALPGALATTDADGRYELHSIPDGTYMAYIYSDDNPGYISRTSEGVMLSGGKTVGLKPVSLIRLLQPTNPKPGGIARVGKGSVGFAWSGCEGASSYKLVIKGVADGAVAAQLSSTKPKLDVAASKFRPDTQYEAKVSAYNSDGQILGTTSGGPAWKFEVEWPL